MTPDRARDIVDTGIRAYFAACRARVPGFVDRHFSLAGSARLHRAALGWDLLRAPANLSLAAPALLWRLAGAGAHKLGHHGAAEAIRARPLLLKTAVVREIDWLVRTELLELPASDGDREATRDALAETIFADPRVTAELAALLRPLGAAADDPELRRRVEETLAEYTATRAAAAEITTGLLTLSAGAIALQKLTPGAATLGPVLAAMVAQQTAVAAFPLGSGLGGLWYAAFPAAPSVGLVAGLTGGLMLGAAAFAAFAGLVADPVQRRLGLHRRRLVKMLDALERQMLTPGAPGFAARDHYVARLLDVFDWVGTLARTVLR